ncbi:hypothetical protein HPB50_010156 [Hyalomma asiaticum]|uniref:Uncharacterized protein n=1 Tax=Hyalomma asiaticum TaxID=266040 RepID=A0ACB7T3N5_HYAAI|nr:hypothetical protein HPB50_010156 [Hyalomma asiaticum]
MHQPRQEQQQPPEPDDSCCRKRIVASDLNSAGRPKFSRTQTRGSSLLTSSDLDTLQPTSQAQEPFAAPVARLPIAPALTPAVDDEQEQCARDVVDAFEQLHLQQPMPRAKQPQQPAFRQHAKYGVNMRPRNASTTKDSAAMPSSSGHSMAGGAVKDYPQTVLRQGAMPSPKDPREQGRSKLGCRRPTYLYGPTDYRVEQLERMMGLQTKLRELRKHNERMIIKTNLLQDQICQLCAALSSRPLPGTVDAFAELHERRQQTPRQLGLHEEAASASEASTSHDLGTQPSLSGSSVTGGAREDELKTVPLRGVVLPLTPIDMPVGERIKSEANGSSNRVLPCRRRIQNCITCIEAKVHAFTTEVKALKAENAFLKVAARFLLEQVRWLREEATMHNKQDTA